MINNSSTKHFFLWFLKKLNKRKIFIKFNFLNRTKVFMLLVINLTSTYLLTEYTFVNCKLTETIKKDLNT